MRKVFFGGFLGIGVLIAAFFFLLRSCLAAYDERFALPPALYFEKDGRRILFSIVEYQKATSYSSGGGVTRKTVSTSYYVQNNDAATAARISDREVKEHSDLRSYPVETLGASGNRAWVFMGELMAFDPFTLQTVADHAAIEKANPGLKGQLPAERRYYHLQAGQALVYFTANDGRQWRLHTGTLKAEPFEFGDADDLDGASFTVQKSALDQHKALEDTLEERYRILTQQIIATARNKGFAELKKLYALRSAISEQQEALRRQVRRLEQAGQWDRQQRLAINQLRRTSVDYNSMRTNQDTADGNWLGLYAGREWTDLNDHLQFSAAYDETARRQLYRSRYTEQQYGGFILLKKEARLQGGTTFLQGGFLLDKETARPIRLTQPASYLILHREGIGRDAAILLSRVTPEGKLLWTFNSRLKEWTDWQLRSGRLFVSGKDEPRTNGSNLLYSLDLKNGQAAAYDFYTDKVRP